MTESNVNQERLLAQTLVELREVYTRARMLLPALSMPELLMLSGAIEQAKTAGMAKTKAGPRAKTSRRKAPANPRKSSLSVFVGKDQKEFAFVASLLMEKKGPMTVRALLDTIKDRGWKLNTKSEWASQIVRVYLKRRKDLFTCSQVDGEMRFRLVGKRGRPAKAKGASSSWRAQKDARAKQREEVIRTLKRAESPLTINELGTKMGRKNGVGLVPILRAFQERGLVKQLPQGADQEPLWDPVKDKLRAYKEPSMLNGAAVH